MQASTATTHPQHDSITLSVCPLYLKEKHLSFYSAGSPRQEMSSSPFSSSTVWPLPLLITYI